MATLALIKEQIFIAQVKCKTLSKKLKRKIRRLNLYFLDSFLVTRSDGSRIRKIKALHSKCGKVRSVKKNQLSRSDIRNTLPKRKNQINHNVYVSRRKRRKSRIFKRVHSGPISASKGLLTQLDTPADSTSNADSDHKNSTQPEKLDFNPVSNPASKLNKHRPQTSVVRSRWIVLSKRKACFVPANLAIFDYKEAKLSKHVSSVLGFKCVQGEYRLGWAKKYSKQMDPSTSIRQLSIKLGEYFAYKKLGIASPKPLIPAGFKVIRVKAQNTYAADRTTKNEYSLWKKTRKTLAKSSTNVFCGAGPKQRVSGSKGSVADFFIPISRFIESRTKINSLTQCSRLSQTDKDSVIAVATAISMDAANINIEIDSTVNALNSLTQGYSPFDRRLFSHSNIFMTHLINLLGYFFIQTRFQKIIQKNGYKSLNQRTL